VSHADGRLWLTVVGDDAYGYRRLTGVSMGTSRGRMHRYFSARGRMRDSPHRDRPCRIVRASGARSENIRQLCPFFVIDCLVDLRLVLSQVLAWVVDFTNFSCKLNRIGATSRTAAAMVSPHPRLGRLLFPARRRFHARWSPSAFAAIPRLPLINICRELQSNSQGSNDNLFHSGRISNMFFVCSRMGSVGNGKDVGSGSF
jgi:hypothetical protein